MAFMDLLKKPGEHSLILQGEAGLVEAILTVPNQENRDTIAFLGHPHSLQGGTMNNKVVTTTARAFKELQIPSLRFNFRGVGQSAGSYDNGIGESKDMLALVSLWSKEFSPLNYIFTGFSFGSYVAYRAAAQVDHALLISIAPPVHHYNFHEYKPSPHPWVIFQGDKDEVVPYSEVLDFAQRQSPAIPVIEFLNTGHFFHGNLLALKTQLIECIQNKGYLK